MEEKLEKLRGGVTLVKPEERKAVQDMFVEKIRQWRRRKRMFKDLWDTITENSPKDLKEFKVLCFDLFSRTYFRGGNQVWGLNLLVFLQEELGLEYDEDVGVCLQSLCNLQQNGKKRPRSQ